MPVLKFNLNKRFTTGIYDYTLMQSSFTPIQRQTYPNSLRVTTSNIEWCGAFLTNTRLTEEGYRVDYQSYFDGEEDLSLTLPKVWLEDEIWNVIRINPELLPLGTVRMVPSILTEELTHHPLALAEATATLEQHDNLSVYTLDYPTLPRLLAITFESAFPHRLVRWEETFETVAGWGMEPQVMTTRAERIRYTMLDYWERKYLKDEVLRMTELGIE
ncbi:MAG TPA: hypothetical protein DCE41_06085 [Cytophagales bacterium]|nr:hypothetical protein [Cytophagales bacterium]